MSGAGAFDLAGFEAATGAGRARRAAGLDAACRETGFLILSGHGVAPATIEALRDRARAVFDLPPEAKARLAPAPGRPYGWIGPGREALARALDPASPFDLKESFNGGPRDVPEGLADPDALAFCYAPTPWPDVPGFRAAWEAYHAAMEALGARVMAAMAEALGLPRGHFAPFFRAPVSALRALNYPGQAGPGALGAGAHTDYGSLTILLPQDGSRGLEIAGADGDWREVAPVPAAFVVNLGDLMARWTGGRWVSTLHRVRATADRRLSIAFFQQPDWSAAIETLPGVGPEAYPPVLSGPYLMARFRGAGG